MASAVTGKAVAPQLQAVGVIEKGLLRFLRGLMSCADTNNDLIVWTFPTIDKELETSNFACFVMLSHCVCCVLCSHQNAVRSAGQGCVFVSLSLQSIWSKLALHSINTGRPNQKRKSHQRSSLCCVTGLLLSALLFVVCCLLTHTHTNRIITRRNTRRC